MSKYEEYRWKWDNYPKLHKVDRVPIHIDLEITTRCNLRCPFCPLTNSKVKPQDMPFHRVIRIIDEFTEKGGYSIKFVYLGEALLYPHLGRVIKYAKDKGIIETIIATNGNLLTDKIANELIESGLDFIIFSVDSCKYDTYKRIRKNGDLGKVIKGISILQCLKQIYETNKPKIQIQAIPMKLNKDELTSGEYHNFWKGYVDVIRVSPYCMDYSNTKIIGETPNFLCNSVFRRLTVRVNGDISICCGQRLDSKILGNINDNTLEEIWLGERFIEIRKLMRERKSHLIEACKTCPSRLCE